MATKTTIPRNGPQSRAQEERDQCSLCLKNYQQPKILPCFHSYCLSCLKSYTQANAYKHKFACPLCAKECIMPQNGVEDLQTNFYIQAAQAKLENAANSVCEVCDDGPRADRSCIECKQNMCPTCSRSHVKMTASRDHHLVTLKERAHVGESQMTSKSFCEKHKGDELTFYCRKCCVPICLRCKVTSHEQHETEDLSDVAQEIRVVLNDLLKGAQGILPQFYAHLNDLTSYGDQLEKEADKLKEDISEQTKALHQAVDELSQKVLAEVQDEHRVEMARLDTRRHMLSDKTSAFSLQLHSANQVINFGSDPDLAWNKDSLAAQLQAMSQTKSPAELVRLRMEFLPSDANSRPDFEDIFGALKKVRDPQEVVVVDEVSTFSVDSSFKAVSSVCPIDDSTAWIALGWTADVYHFYRQGLKIKSHIVSKTVDSIAKDEENNLLMTSNEQKSIGKPGPGFNLDTLTTFPGYHPRGITVASNGDILICLAQSAAFQDFRPGHKNKVVRLSSSGKVKQEYGADGKLFMYPLRVAVNVNGDICVSDSKKMCVTILKADGSVKAQYKPSAETQQTSSSFEPRGIACDSRGHIFVADGSSNSIHLLDHTGKHVRLLVTEKDGLYGPYSVAVDEEDHLWVGCRDANVKVYKLTWA